MFPNLRPPTVVVVVVVVVVVLVVVVVVAGKSSTFKDDLLCVCFRKNKRIDFLPQF